MTTITWVVDRKGKEAGHTEQQRSRMGIRDTSKKSSGDMHQWTCRIKVLKIIT